MVTVSPTGADNGQQGPFINPASFDNVLDFINFIVANGVEVFDNGFNSYTFTNSVCTGAKFGDAFSLEINKRGEAVVRFFWSAELQDTKKEDGVRTLNSFILGSSVIKVQDLWNKVLAWGETHRDEKRTDIWGSELKKGDAMFKHNFAVFKERMRTGAPLTRDGDRGSYTESVGAMQAQYDRDVAAKEGVSIMYGVFASPFLIWGAAEAGVAGLFSGTISARAASAGSEAATQYLANVTQYGFGADNFANINVTSIIGNFIIPNSAGAQAIIGNSFSLSYSGGYQGIGSGVTPAFMLTNIGLDYIGNRVGNVHGGLLGDGIGNGTQLIFQQLYNLNNK